MITGHTASHGPSFTEEEGEGGARKRESKKRCETVSQKQKRPERHFPIGSRPPSSPASTHSSCALLFPPLTLIPSVHMRIEKTWYPSNADCTSGDTSSNTSFCESNASLSSCPLLARDPNELWLRAFLICEYRQLNCSENFGPSAERATGSVSPWRMAPNADRSSTHERVIHSFLPSEVSFAMTAIHRHRLSAPLRSFLLLFSSRPR